MAAKAWTQEAADKLLKKPGTYPHPTEAGLYLRVGKTGASWGFKFRDGKDMPNGKIGDYEEVPIDKVVEKYQSIRRRYALAGTSAGRSLAEAFDSWLPSTRKKDGDELSATTLFKYKQWFDKYLRSAAGDLLLTDITPEQWLGHLRKARVQSKHEARALYWLMHGMLEYYAELDVLNKNTLHNKIIKRELTGKDTQAVRQTQVQAIDLPRFIANTNKVRGRGSREIITFLLLTGWRKTCVLRMRWEQVDLESNAYLVEKGNVGWKGYIGPITINSYAQAILEEQRKLTGEKEYVFGPGTVSSKTPYRVDVRGAIRGACKGLKDIISPHDLRRTFVTVGEVVTNGNLRLIGRIIGHSQRSTVQGKNSGSIVTNKYVIRNLTGEYETSSLIAETIMEIGDALPMSDETIKMFESRGVKFEKLELAEVEDDDDGS